MDKGLINWMLAAALAAFASGCTPEAKQDVNEAGQEVGQAGRRTGEAVDRRVDVDMSGANAEDLAMTGKVKSALIADEWVKARKIDVDTAKNVIHLRGTVNSQAEKDRAETLAKKQGGNEFTVMNHLEIQAEKAGG